MSQELYEVTCVKHQNTEQTTDPENWICSFCKEQKEHSFQRLNRCDKNHKWFGNESCPQCKILDMKERAARRLPTQLLQIKLTGSDQVVSMAKALDEKRIKKIKEEREVKHATIQLPVLLTELINEVKLLRGELKE